MKKIIFLLLLISTTFSYGQTTLANKLKITGNVEDITATKVAVQTNEGLINWRDVLDIRGNGTILSTGLIKNGLISANGDPTKFNVTSGIGVVSNFDTPENPISRLVTFPVFTGVTPTYLLTGTITYVAIEEIGTSGVGQLFMQATPFTTEQRRSLIVLGAVIHSNLTTINVINNISAPTNASTNQLHDFIEAVGALNLTGNKYTANGANLQLDKSAGLIFKLGSNFANDWKNPHELAQTAGTSLTFRYRTQNGTEGSDRINLDPALYDLNNVLTSVPNNKFTIQTVTMFQSGVTRIQYGQTVYDDLATAKNAVFTRNFVLEPNSKENGIIRAYIIMRNTTTSLQAVADADILEAQKFGGVASGGVALTLANIVTALGYTPENLANKQNSLAVDGTGTKYATVDAINAKLPTTYTKIVYVNTTSPTTATIFDLNNPPVTNDNALKNDVNNLYIGTDASTWVYITSPAGYVTKTVTSETSNFYISNTTIDAGNTKSANISRTGTIESTGFVKKGATFTDALLAGGLTLANPISGTGSPGYLSYFTGLRTLNSSNVYISGGNTGFGTTTPQGLIDIKGTGLIRVDDPSGYGGFNMYDDTNTLTASFAIGATGAGALPNTFFFGSRKTGNNVVVLAGNGIDSKIKVFSSTGAVTIGSDTENGSGARLQVNGNITGTNYTGGATLTGNPTAPTATVGDNDTSVATTAYVTSAVVASASKWTQTGNDIVNNNTGKVGIGSPTGAYKLNLSGVGIDTSGNIYSNYIYPSVIEGGRFLNLTGISNSNALIKYSTDLSGTYDDRTLVDKGFNDKNRMKSFTVATLPASPTQGDSYAVTDALAPAYLVTVVGGGTVYAPVVWNGTNWISH